ncbi:hypothetical protein F5B20DRAFT_295728 [Whalleya microplaca]|nr:hypothetical protein F5B20DRAFT_295728 [Whalleya microplaca]
MSTTTDVPQQQQRPRFWLTFRLFSDGLSTSAAARLALGGGGGSSPETFPRFPDLPAELRLKIWEYLLAPRIVAIACHSTPSPSPSSPVSEIPPEGGGELLDADVVPVPVLLHVSAETRRLALAHYEPAFAWKVPLVLAQTDLLPPPAGKGAAGTWSRPRAWFNYALDAVYLRGELEPYDSYGFNSPMAYFLGKEEARRVRRVAVAFSALRYGEAGSQQIFGALFHVVDRFVPADGRVLVTVTDRDEMTHRLMGGEAPLVGSAEGVEEEEWGNRGAECEVRVKREGGGKGQEEEVNVVQKIWRDWYRGSIVTSSLVKLQFVLVRESELEHYMAQPIPSTAGNAASSRR